MKIQRVDKAEGDAKGLDYLVIWTGLPGCSPIWGAKENALEFDSTEEIMSKITEKYGYRLVAGSNENPTKKDILNRMKSGELQKDVAIQMLRELSRTI